MNRQTMTMLATACAKQAEPKGATFDGLHRLHRHAVVVADVVAGRKMRRIKWRLGREINRRAPSRGDQRCVGSRITLATVATVDDRVPMWLGIRRPCRA